MKRLLGLVLWLWATAVFGQGGGYGPSTGGGSSGGAQTPTSVSGTNPGVFTNTVMNEPFLFTTTGGGTCDTATILGVGSVSATKLTDGIAVCLNIPTSGVTNGFSNGFAAYLHNPNPNALGQFGWTGAVGYYDQVWCDANSTANTHCWGANFSVTDSPGKSATIFGNEYDVGVNQNATAGAGNLFSYRGNGQPAFNTLPALWLQTPSGTGAWTSGLFCDNGATAISLGAVCIMIGRQSGTLGSASQWLYFKANDGGADHLGAMSMVSTPTVNEIKTLSVTFGSNTVLADQGTACTNGELVLSAGWQSTGSATVTGVVGTGQTCEWTITTGTTTAANPTVTDTLTNPLPAATTVCWMIITGGNRTAAAGDSFDQTTLSATTPVFTFQGTPTAGGKTYKVVRTCGP